MYFRWNCMTNLIIQVLDYKKGDEHRTISIRMSEKYIKELKQLAAETNQSRNALVNQFIEYGLENYVIK